MSIRNIKMLVLILVFSVTLNLANYIIVSCFYNPQWYEKVKTRPLAEPPRHNPGLGKAAYKSQDQNRDISAALPPSNQSTTNSVRKECNDSYDEPESNGEALKPINGDYMIYMDKNRDKICPEIPTGLGPFSYYTPSEKHNIKINFGGHTKVKNCKPRQSAAIIVPFTGEQPVTFIKYLRSFLRRQQLEYRIFAVTNGNSTQPLNLGKLINAAFTEIHRRYQKRGIYNCIIVHDPTIVPVNTRNLYRCSWYPRQLATRITWAHNKTSYKPKFDRVVALTHEQYIKVNGFTNVYLENDAIFYDMFKRLTAVQYFIEYTPFDVGEYVTLSNDSNGPIEKYSLSRPPPRAIFTPLNLQDGLTSLTYTVKEFEPQKLYTYIKINLLVDPRETSVYKGNLWDRLQSIVKETTPTPTAIYTAAVDSSSQSDVD